MPIEREHRTLFIFTVHHSTHQEEKAGFSPVRSRGWISFEVPHNIDYFRFSQQWMLPDKIQKRCNVLLTISTNIPTVSSSLSSLLSRSPSPTISHPQHPQTPSPLLPPSPPGLYPHCCYPALAPRCVPRYRLPSPPPRVQAQAINDSILNPLGTSPPNRVRYGRTDSCLALWSRFHMPRRHSARR